MATRFADAVIKRIHHLRTMDKGILNQQKKEWIKHSGIVTLSQEDRDTVTQLVTASEISSNMPMTVHWEAETVLVIVFPHYANIPPYRRETPDYRGLFYTDFHRVAMTTSSTLVSTTPVKSSE